MPSASAAILAAIAAIERSPALQRGFDNRKSKTASRSDARIQPSKCLFIEFDAMPFGSTVATRRRIHFPPKPGDEIAGLRSSSASADNSSRDSGNRAGLRSSFASADNSSRDSGNRPGYVHRSLTRAILAAIAAIERSPALQRGFDNRKSKTASRSDARIQPSKCHSSNSMRCLSVQPSRRDDGSIFHRNPAMNRRATFTVR